MTALPVDFRSCRSPACSDGPETGRVTRSRAGRPVTLFTHLIDCREPGAGGIAGLRLLRRAGGPHLHPVLGVLRRLRHLAGTAGRPRVPRRRLGGRPDQDQPDGSVDARASSHNGYNGADAPAVDWASDAAGEVPGAEQIRDISESLGLRDDRGWTRSDGTLHVSGGSHAGHATEGSLQRELAAQLANMRLGLSGRELRGPLGRAGAAPPPGTAGQPYPKRSLRARRPDDPPREHQACPARVPRRPGLLLVRGHPAVAEARLLGSGIPGHGLTIASAGPRKRRGGGGGVSAAASAGRRPAGSPLR